MAIILSIVQVSLSIVNQIAHKVHIKIIRLIIAHLAIVIVKFVKMELGVTLVYRATSFYQFKNRL